MATKIIGIIGNIGAGKSTLGEFLAGSKVLEHYLPECNLRYFHEEVDEAAKELFYKDREKYTNRFEKIQAELRVLRHALAAAHPGIAIFDRTLIEGSETFRRNSFADGYLSFRADAEYDSIIKDACDELGRSREKQEKWVESYLIYLKVKDPRILQQRQKKRGDKKENIIPLDYFRHINKMYDTFTRNIDSCYRKWGLESPKLLVLDGSKDLSDGCLEEHAGKIGRKLREWIYGDSTTG